MKFKHIKKNMLIYIIFTILSLNLYSAQTINWNGNNWALGCDFTGNDLINERISGSQCGDRCSKVSDCTHWTWTNYKEGTCWMKSGSVSKKDAKYINNNAVSCGIIDIYWNGNNWALGCAFAGNDLNNEKTHGDQCGDRCSKVSGCTHWTWTNYNGGTCWMKTGTISKNDAMATGDSGVSCGVISSTTVNSNSGSVIHWNGNNWALGCDFTGNDLINEKIMGDQCGDRCSKVLGCTHWTWTNYNGGTCWMKTGSTSTSNAKATVDNSVSCGVLSGVGGSTSDQSVNWNGFNWALGCDFPGNDIETITPLSGALCGDRCGKRSDCSHWAWTQANGGTCKLKSASINRYNAISTGDLSMTCGVIKETAGSSSGSGVIWNGNNWALGCDFPGNDIETIKPLSGALCGDRCGKRSDCSHWAWTQANGGTCKLKSASINRYNAISTGDLSMTCGVIKETAGSSSGSGVVWNGNNWALGCDFPGNDIQSISPLNGAQCGDRCGKRSDCSHWAWTQANGGTCKLKKASINRFSAISTGDKSMTCGVIKEIGGSGGGGPLAPLASNIFPYCKFRFGTAYDSKTAFDTADYITIWIGYGGNFRDSYHGEMLRTCKNKNKLPVFYGYIIAFLGRSEWKLQDCNVGEINLCKKGAEFIRQKRASILSIYANYASETAKIIGRNTEIIVLIEPDFWQYYGQPTQEGGGLSGQQISSLYNDIAGTVRASLPNAKFGWDVSPWLSEQAMRDYWNYFAGSPYVDYLFTSGGESSAESYQIRPGQLSWSFMSSLTGRRIIADTGYGVAGVGTGHNSAYDNINNLRSRIADGVIVVTQSNPRSDWGNILNGVRSNLAALCNGGSSSLVSSSSNGLVWFDNNWSLGCDFPGNDIGNSQIPSDKCGGTCAVRAGCTHFAWSNYNGGTCWLKSASVRFEDAVAKNDRSMVCGIIHSIPPDDGFGRFIADTINKIPPNPSIPSISDSVDNLPEFQNAVTAISNFFKKFGKREWKLSELNNAIILYASAGVSIDNDIFITVNVELKGAIIKIIQKSGSPIAMVDIEVFKAGLSIKFGSYNGFELYVALVDGKVSVFDIKLGFGISSGAGINKDSMKVELFGSGFVVGRRLGISVFDNSFAIDFKRFFTDAQWNSIQPVVHVWLKASLPQFVLLGDTITLITNFLTSGRTIAMALEDFTFYDLQFIDQYFNNGAMKDSPAKYIKRGGNTQFSVEKKIGFYGVEGTIIYRAVNLNKDFVFYFSNPISGGNTIAVRSYNPGKSAKSLYDEMADIRKPSAHEYKEDDTVTDTKFIYTITTGNNAKAVFRLISRKLVELIK